MNLHQNLSELFPWYVNGTLSPSEREKVEARLGEQKEACTELRAWQTLQAGMASQPALSPSPIVRQRVLAAIRQPLATHRSRFSAIHLMGGTALSLCILILLWLAVRPGVVLQWSVEKDGVEEFKIYRASQESDSFELVGKVSARSERSAYTFVDTLLVPGRVYTYRVEGLHPDGVTAFSPVVTGRSLDALPAQMALLLTSAVLGYGIALFVPNIRRIQRA